MDDSLKADLQRTMHNAYHLGIERGRLLERIDRRMFSVVAFLLGALMGLVGGLGVTGWL